MAEDRGTIRLLDIISADYPLGVGAKMLGGTSSPLSKRTPENGGAWRVRSDRPGVLEPARRNPRPFRGRESDRLGRRRGQQTIDVDSSHLVDGSGTAWFSSLKTVGGTCETCTTLSDSPWTSLDRRLPFRVSRFWLGMNGAIPGSDLAAVMVQSFCNEVPDTKMTGDHNTVRLLVRFSF